MKFNVKIATIPTAEDKTVGNMNPCTKVDIEGDLEAVKTYIKLKAGSNFNWGAIQRKDELKQGDVEWWMVKRNSTTGEMNMEVFAFYDVDPSINVNAFNAAFDERTSTGAVNKLLGGGKF